MININIALKENKDYVGDALSILAHEVGHAYKGAAVPPPVSPPREGVTREQWIEEQMYFRFLDEAEAELMFAQVRREILDNGGPDIPGPSSRDVDTAAIDAYNSYSAGNISREEARVKVADIINNPQGVWYRDYYPHYRKLSNNYFGN